MVRTCPHCKMPLQPGEVYLGWCGECGNSLSRPPEHPEPPPKRLEPLPQSVRPSARRRPPPVPADWRWVARGMLVKLVAMLAGVGGAVVIADAAGWDVRRAFTAPLPLGVGVLLAALGVDIIGRLLCLCTPQAAARGLVIASVACQLCAVPLAVGAVLAPPGTEDRWSLWAGAVLLQIVAAITYTVYLLTLGIYFRSPLVMTLAVLIKVAMAGTVGVVAVAAVIVILLVVLFVIGVVLAFACPCLGCLVMGAAGKLGEAAVEPITIGPAVVLGLVELAYGTTLLAVLWELWRRRLLFRRP